MAAVRTPQRRLRASSGSVEVTAFTLPDSDSIIVVDVAVGQRVLRYQPEEFRDLRKALNLLFEMVAP